MLDLVLAIAHHIAAFAIFGVIATEFFLLSAELDAAAVRRHGKIDAAYGSLAAAILLLGFGRALLAAKGWDYYSGNALFWAKLATFLLIGLLSISPTLAYIRWRRDGAIPPGDQVATVRRFVLIELLLFVPLLVFAAAMARGFGAGVMPRIST